MWLLSTDRAELHFFATPQDVPDGYAILSHVWDMDGPEQSFQDTELLAAKYSGPTDSPRKHASRKVRECCKLAQKHGFSWLWIDTWCIDKRSSAELSEAINSMFRYYQLARICYVYLFDMEVPPIPSPAMESAFVTRHPSERNITSDPSLTIMFSNSKWHKRGWTLQELLASKFVAFFSRDWQLLGSKSDLSSLLEAITRIPQPVLTLQTPLSSVSISGRMQWAAERKTTRPEDEAYCLLGIFDITMPLLYGEGGRRRSCGYRRRL
ncbi:hypothetical protein GSI_11943 [Ganoderma sinense ZZ0214-1]|uniref:Heterokaryon incompatibility domain-containing protein n=1 Tax=Ganoderma sinense ZZ0214-1 TaxID=1077348 RepID=A0A2G8RXZ3_9APHY|nr:hypothetical protein GSI_11943 [Ganoderma sinense ZZ0214-1]